MMLRMLPPASLKRRASKSKSRSRVAGHVGREERLPDAQPVLLLGEGEVDGELQPPGEGLVQVGAQVGGQDGHAVVGLHALQQVADLDVGVAVVGVLDLGALAEERVGLVEEEDGVAALAPR